MKNLKVLALAFFTLGVTGLASAQSEPEKKATTEIPEVEVKQEIQESKTEQSPENTAKPKSKTDHSTQPAEESVKTEVPSTSSNRQKAKKED